MKRKYLVLTLTFCMIFGTYNPLIVTAEETEGFASSAVIESPASDDDFIDSFEDEENEMFTDECSTFNDNVTSYSDDYISVNDYIEYRYEEETKTLYFQLKAGVTSAEMPNNVRKAEGVWSSNYAPVVERIVIGDGITSIGNNDFALVEVGNDIYYGKLKEVVLPTTVTSIGKSAFSEVTTLTDINLSNVVSIGSSAFKKNGIETISFSEKNSVVIGDSAFEACKKLSSVNAGNLSLGESTFSDCDNLTSVKANNLSISNYTFSGCKALTTLEYSNKLESIPDMTFINTALTSFDFSEVKEIGEMAFYGTALKTIAFGQSEITMWDMAFDDCNELVAVCYPGTEAQWKAILDENANEMPETAKMHCKADTIEAKGATCTENGWKEVGYCEACGEHYSYENDENKVAALGHDFVVSDSKEATCTEAGYITKTCNKCGETTTEEIEPLGHDFEKDYTVDMKATCTTDGKQSKHCSRCDAKEDEQKIPALGHDFAKDYTVDVKATCTTDGEQSKHCSRCDAKEDGQKIAALGHDFTSKVTKEATCTADGVITKTCSRCDATETEAIKATGHKFGDWKVTAEATVFAPEQQERICETCGIKETKAEGTALKATATVNASTVKLKVKQSTSGLKVTSLAMGDSVKTWKSTNTKIFTVKGKANGTCKLTAKKAGTAKLQITLASGLKKTVTVKVQKSNVKTTKVSVSNKNVSVKKGKKVTLKPVVTPFTSKQKVTYTSSNKKVATVSAKGVVTGKKKGTAKITIKSGSKSVKVTVRVK